MRTVPSNGTAIPALGFGTWQIEGEDCTRMVEAALGMGYRHLDTAQGYGNEAQVGAGLKKSSVSRDDVFLTTKVTPDHIRAGEIVTSAQESLGKLGVDAVDLLLLHWPTPERPLEETLAELAQAHEQGLARAVGVSNYPSALVEEAVSLSSVPLATDQVEYHPYLAQQTLRKALGAHGMSLTAYSPFAQGAIMDDEVLRGIADGHGATVGQVALAWLMGQDGVIAIPKTQTESRAHENLGALQVELSDDERAAIHALTARGQRIIDPPFGPDWDAA